MTPSNVLTDSFEKLLQVQQLLRKQQLPEARLLAVSIQSQHMRERAILLCTLSRPVDTTRVPA
ncbi:MAG TPA: hypothetical protein VKD72_10395 [Gemmataceae bacterium]|nr:hypothetical protein [Gemmataceae bacterium]